MTITVYVDHTSAVQRSACATALALVHAMR